VTSELALPSFLLKKCETVQINRVKPSKIAPQDAFMQIHFQSRQVENEIRLLAVLASGRCGYSRLRSSLSTRIFHTQSRTEQSGEDSAAN
jgi:hypothetical protein